MTAPVSVVIAVHSAQRPIGRAVASVLDGNGDLSEISVVCHNIAAETIAAQLAPEHRDQVRYLEHHDGIASPAGPFNAGMRAATGDYVSIMGSDDTLAPGAVRSWLGTARATGAETVITRLELGGRRVPTPPVRPLRRLRPGLLDPVKDRVSYRSAPLGLVSLAAKRRLDTELVEPLLVGSDVPYVTRLWFETAVAYDSAGPGYRIGEDATDRVTYAPRPIVDTLACIEAILQASWFAEYSARARAAVAQKVTRIHVFGAVWHRQDAAWWTADEREQLAAVTAALQVAVPGYADPLSRADRALLDACADPAVPAAELIRRANARRRFGRPATVIPSRLASALHREAPPRFMCASLLAR